MTTRWKDFDTRSAAQVRAELMEQSRNHARERDPQIKAERERLAKLWEEGHGFDKHGVGAFIRSGGTDFA